MRRWLIRVVVALALLGVLLVATAFWSDSDTAVLSSHISGGNSIIRPGWRGTPLDQRGRFMNDEYVYLPRTLDLLRWTWEANPFEDEKARDPERIEIKDPAAFLSGNDDGILWLGHASFFIRSGGTDILIDPVFGKPPIINEFVSVPSPLEKLENVDLILISHDHRDHMDAATIDAVTAKFPNAVLLAGLRSEEILSSWKTPSNRISTAGWFEKFTIADNEGGGVNVYFMPVRHWSRRGLFDTNHRLWGGFVIESGETTIYFSGDSGYGRHYRETGELFPEIDHFIIGIGAFEPRWFMEANHNSPADAVKAFIDSGAKTMIPMHYGRFDLSDEPANMPLGLLMKEAEKAGITDKITPLKINESIGLTR